MNIGFIGLGIMGSAMSTNILKKSDENLIVYDINKEASNKLKEIGAEVADSIKDIAHRCEVIITMVPKNEHVISVYNELIPEVKKGSLLIDMSTISPEVSRNLAIQVEKEGSRMIDAPVVKSQAAAIEGTLGIYVGGKEEDYNKARKYLEYMGNNIIYLGENGNGLIMKLCHNALVAQIQNGVNETLKLATKVGNIKPEVFAKAISYGGGQNFYLDSKINAIKERNFKTAFSIANMDKDIHLADNLAKESNLILEGIKLACKRYEEAMSKGYGLEDFSATYKLFD